MPERITFITEAGSPSLSDAEADVVGWCSAVDKFKRRSGLDPGGSCW
jgi:hypothetical protein